MSKLTVRFVRDLKTHLESDNDLEDFFDDENEVYPSFEKRRKKKFRNEYEED